MTSSSAAVLDAEPIVVERPSTAPVRRRPRHVLSVERLDRRILDELCRRDLR